LIGRKPVNLIVGWCGRFLFLGQSTTKCFSSVFQFFLFSRHPKMSLTILFEGRREVVKPTLSQTLSLIFQRACDKFKISSAKYTLW